MVEVEQGYGSGEGDGVTNLYHNRRHATDVTQAVHYFLRVSGVWRVACLAESGLGERGGGGICKIRKATSRKIVGFPKGFARDGVMGIIFFGGSSLPQAMRFPVSNRRGAIGSG